MDEDWGTAPLIEAIKVCLRDVQKPRRTTIEYLYDFGDSWAHRLTVTATRLGRIMHRGVTGMGQSADTM